MVAAANRDPHVLVGGVCSNGFSIYGSRNDTITPHGRFFFHLMASLAQMERELTAERTKAGLDAARKRGRVVGRNRRMTPGKIESAKQLLDAEMTSRAVAKILGVSIPTLYRWAPASSHQAACEPIRCRVRTHGMRKVTLSAIRSLGARR